MATQMSCAALTLGNFCRAVQIPQNSKKFVNMQEYKWQRKGKAGHGLIEVKSTIYNLCNTINKCIIRNDAKWKMKQLTKYLSPVPICHATFHSQLLKKHQALQ